MATNTQCIDSIVDDFYTSKGMTGTMDIVRRVIVKQAMKNESSEWTKNNDWVREDIDAITAYQKSHYRKNKLTDILK